MYGYKAGGIALAGGATLTAASLNNYAALQIGGGSTLTVWGQANLGGSLAVIGNSSVQLSNLGYGTTTTLALWKRVEESACGSGGNDKESQAERTAWR